MISTGRFLGPTVIWLAGSSRATPAVMEKILPAVEADLAVLTDAGELARLNEAQRAEAAQTAAGVRVAVAKLKAAIASRPAAAVPGSGCERMSSCWLMSRAVCCTRLPKGKRWAGARHSRGRESR